MKNLNILGFTESFFFYGRGGGSLKTNIEGGLPKNGGGGGWGGNLDSLQI